MNPKDFINSSIRSIREETGSAQVVLGLSGGVDSSVAALLIHKAIGERLIPIFVDTGCLRHREAERVREAFSAIPDLNIRFVDASELFLKRLEGVEDPEEKRRIIGHGFIEVFESEARKHPGVEFLAQGTLYPDVMESLNAQKGLAVKSHHNVGGLPEKMGLKLLEPFRKLYKDDVRAIGRELGLPEKLVSRHPFPGPGLAVRVIGAITPQRLKCLRAIDEIFISELHSQKLYHTTWQAFAVLLPIRSVGVKDGSRSYENVCALRAVNSVDGMSADWTRLPLDFLAQVSARILSEVPGVNRVVYDISSKPPATIEWE